jgi:hypothetical protein
MEEGGAPRAKDGVGRAEITMDGLPEGDGEDRETVPDEDDWDEGRYEARDSESDDAARAVATTLPDASASLAAMLTPACLSGGGTPDGGLAHTHADTHRDLSATTVPSGAMARQTEHRPLMHLPHAQDPACP